MYTVYYGAWGLGKDDYDTGWFNFENLINYKKKKILLLDY